MISVLPACAADPSGDELAGESAADGEAGKGDAAAAFTYFTVTPDLRACSFNTPHCGGYYVARANRTTTSCGPGVMAERCYVESIDLGQIGFPSSVAAHYLDNIRAGKPVLLRADYVSVVTGTNNLKLSATEVWTGNEGGTADGVFVLLKSNGIQCITAPCPDLTEMRLNSSRNANIDTIDFAPSGADQATILRATEATQGAGVIVVGNRFYPSQGKGRTAHQVFIQAPVPLQ